MSGRVVAALFALLVLVPAGRVFSQNTPSTLHTFSSTEGINPNSLIQGKDGLFYGTAALGGSALLCTDYYGDTVGCCLDANNSSQSCGTLFRVNADDTITVLYNFTGLTDGGMPTGLVQGGDGYLYGTTAIGGASINQTSSCDDDGSESACCVDGNGNWVGCGTIFRISPTTVIPPTQTIDPLYSFYTADVNGNFANSGAFPNSLVVGGTVSPGGTDSVFFGSALACSYCSSSVGMLFTLAVSADGAAQMTPLYDFAASKSSLLYPNSLLEGSDGKLYGTAQLGGSLDCMQVEAPNPPASATAYGCGGAFVYDPATNTETEAPFTPAQGAVNDVRASGVSVPLRAGLRPNAIVRQPQHSLPTFAGGPWSFTEVPGTLAEASDGNIYGSTPPMCAYVNASGDETYTDDYEASPGCGTLSGNNSAEIYNPGTLFQAVPETSGPPAINILYTFTQSGDGGGSLTGLTLGSNGNLYGSSGDSTSSDGEIFDVAPGSGAAKTLLAAFTGGYAALVQGSDGNFYGVTADGELIEAKPSPPLNAPVQLVVAGQAVHQMQHPLFVASSVDANMSATLNWTVSNADSLSARQCYAFAQIGAPGAAAWTGLQTGTPGPDNATFGGSISFTLTAPGTYSYAISCGGNESAMTSLTVTIAPLTISETPLAAGTIGARYSATLTVTGGAGPYTWSIASGTLPGGLQLDPSTGVISGTPTAAGTFSFTAEVKDSQSTPATATASFSITISVPPLTVAQTSLPGATVNSPWSATLSATGGIQPYAWSVAPGSSLPNGLQLNASSGVISGTPTENGTFNFVLEVTDAEKPPVLAGAAFSIIILPSPAPSVAANPTTLAISSPGGSATTTLTFANFTGSSIAVSCSGQPAESTCSVSNASAASASLTVTTAAPSQAALEFPGRMGTAYGLAVPGLIALLAGRRGRRWLLSFALVLLASGAASLAGCGGPTQQIRNLGTPAGTTTLTVTATSGSQSATVQLTLNVQ
jgi:hypothetical protein